MKNLVLGALASVALICAGGAHAADMAVKAPPMAPYVPAPNWTGFYIGVNGGWGWTNDNIDGAVFGGQIGYNWQMSNWVLGIEGDFDGAGISGTRQSVFANAVAPFTDGFSATARTNWLASIRGRLGYVWGPGLLYFTGGGAWEDVTVHAMFSDGFAGQSVAGSFSQTRSGFVIGGGYEWMVAPSWTVRAEYLFYDFSNDNANSLALPNCAVLGCGANVSHNNNEINVFRLGANYKF